jgi:hypothetical protein
MQVMSSDPKQKENPDQPLVYQIRIEGHLDDQWTDWFGNLTITLEDNGDTFLTGIVIDQAMLYGLLRKVRDLGLSLVSVNRVEISQSDVAESALRNRKRGDNECAEHIDDRG